MTKSKVNFKHYSKFEDILLDYLISTIGERVVKIKVSVYNV